MGSHHEIDTLLRDQEFSGDSVLSDVVYRYAESMATVERCIAVVSDLQSGTSRIFNGAFSDVLGLGGYSCENSIWEKAILDKMSPEEREEKYLSELRFYNFLRHLPQGKRADYYLATYLRFNDNQDRCVDVLHRMYYCHENDSEAIRFAICIYGPLTFRLPSKSVAINSVTGKWVELSANTDCNILSTREKQVLTLIETGLTSKDIAESLCISKNTVSRHRQEILAKLQAKNSTEACRRAKQLNIIS